MDPIATPAPRSGIYQSVLGSCCRPFGIPLSNMAFGIGPGYIFVVCDRMNQSYLSSVLYTRSPDYHMVSSLLSIMCICYCISFLLMSVAKAGCGQISLHWIPTSDWVSGRWSRDAWEEWDSNLVGLSSCWRGGEGALECFIMIHHSFCLPSDSGGIVFVVPANNFIWWPADFPRQGWTQWDFSPNNILQLLVRRSSYWK